MQRLSEQAPKMPLACTRVRRAELENKLVSGDIDLALNILLPVNEQVKHTRLAQDELVVVSQANHLNTKQSLTLASYLAQKHVLASSRFSGLGIEDFELGRLGLQRKVALRCQHFLSACRVVANGDMLLTLPKTVATMFSKVLALDVHPLPVQLPDIDVHLSWHENVDKEPANQWLRNKILMSSVQG